MSDYGDWDEVRRASDKLHEAMKPVLETRNTAPFRQVSPRSTSLLPKQDCYDASYQYHLKELLPLVHFLYLEMNQTFYAILYPEIFG